MKFVFTDKKVTLPNSIHAYAEKKVGKLDRFFKEDATATITFSVEKERLNQVEITIRSSGTIFRVSESTSDMHASIDAAVTTLERQIRKNKTRLEKRLRQGRTPRRLLLGSATKVPLPRLRTTRPSSSSSPMAWRAVLRLISSARHSSASDGSRSPIFSAPEEISRLMMPTSWAYRGMLLLRDSRLSRIALCSIR